MEQDPGSVLVTISPGPVIEGDGFTVMVNVCDVPVQVIPSVTLGVTVMVAVTGVLPVLIAVKVDISPVPIAASPMEGLSFVQLNTVLGTGLLKVIAVVLLLLQTIWSAGSLTVGIGLITKSTAVRQSGLVEQAA